MIVDGVGSYRADAMETFPQTNSASPLARESESYYRFSGSNLECLKKVWMEPDRGVLNEESTTCRASARCTAVPRLTCSATGTSAAN